MGDIPFSEELTMRTIAFFSQKGGVGKTTACVNIGAALASMGRRVLVIDLDSNACASQYMGVVVEFDESAGAALLGARPLRAVCRPVIPGLWLVPGSTRLLSLDRMTSIADPGRVNAAGRLSERALALELAQVDRPAFDYVLLDCPGGQPFLEKLALLAADEVIVPTGLSRMDLYATAPTLDLVQKTQMVRGDGRPSMLGILPSGAGTRGVPAKLQAMLEAYDLPCFTPVRASAWLRTITGAPQVERRFITLARPDHPAAKSYREIAREIELGIEKARQPSAPPAVAVASELAEIPATGGLDSQLAPGTVEAVPGAS